MKEVKTKYGIISDYLNLEMHSSGQPASLLVTGHTEIETPYGTLIPQYGVDDHGRKEHKYVVFHPNGTIRKVPFQDEQTIETKYGTISSEMLLFHDDGSLKKLFPITGKLSGYWTEKNEYALAEYLTLPLPGGEITAKIINIGLFKSGNVRSITFWPGEVVSMKTAAGDIEVRTGVSFYDNGGIRSLEPAVPTSVETPIGALEAFDNDPNGITGDFNSLCFDQNGIVTALCTTTSRVIVTVDSGAETIYEPVEKESICSSSVNVVVALQIEFINGKVRFSKSASDEYDIAECSFKTEEYVTDLALPCYEC